MHILNWLLLTFILRIWDLLRIQQPTQRPQCRWALWPIRFTVWCAHAATPAKTSHLSSSSFEKRRASRWQHSMPLPQPYPALPALQNFDPTMWFHWHACAGSHEWLSWMNELINEYMCRLKRLCVCTCLFEAVSSWWNYVTHVGPPCSISNPPINWWDAVIWSFMTFSCLCGCYVC